MKRAFLEKHEPIRRRIIESSFAIFAQNLPTMRSISLRLLFSVPVVIFADLPAIAASDSPPAAHAAAVASPESPVTRLVAALTQNDHAGFIADGDDDFKGKLSRAAFDSAAAALAPRLKTGYSLAHLGDLKQHGAQISLWKITYQDGGDDALATLVLRQGKVAGFWIK